MPIYTVKRKDLASALKGASVCVGRAAEDPWTRAIMLEFRGRDDTLRMETHAGHRGWHGIVPLEGQGSDRTCWVVYRDLAQAVGGCQGEEVVLAVNTKRLEVESGAVKYRLPLEDWEDTMPPSPLAEGVNLTTMTGQASDDFRHGCEQALALVRRNFDSAAFPAGARLRTVNDELEMVAGQSVGHVCAQIWLGPGVVEEASLPLSLLDQAKRTEGDLGYACGGTHAILGCGSEWWWWATHDVTYPDIGPLLAGKPAPMCMVYREDLLRAAKAAAAVVPDGRPRCQLQLGEQSLTIRTEGDRAVQALIKAEQVPEPRDLWVRPGYLVDILGAMRADCVELAQHGQLDLVHITPVGCLTDGHYVMTPMRP